MKKLFLLFLVTASCGIFAVKNYDAKYLRDMGGMTSKKAIDEAHEVCISSETYCSRKKSPPVARRLNLRDYLTKRNKTRRKKNR